MRKLIQKIEEYLTTNSGKSSLRLNVTTIVQTGNLCMVGVIIYIIIMASKGLTIDWIGVAGFVIALSSYIGVGLWGKNAGKEKEAKNE